MDIRHLRYFVAVAEALSFAKAARALNMSQPPLSNRIADLERELCLKLLNRTKRKVELTPAGEAFLPRARDAVRTFDEALRLARSFSPSQSRQLRIALPLLTSPSVLFGIVSRLHEEHMHVDIVEASTAEQQHLFAAGQVDIGVLRHPFDKRGLWVSTPLAETLGVMIDVDHPLAKLNKLHLADLNPYALVLIQRDFAPGLYDELLDLCRAGGFVPPKILHLHGGRTMAPLLKTESAVALVPERRVDAGSKGFVWRPLEGSPVHRWASVVCRSDEYVGITRLAVDVILASLQQHENWLPIPRAVAG